MAITEEPRDELERDGGSRVELNAPPEPPPFELLAATLVAGDALGAPSANDNGRR